jgi:predicted nucleic acid-binding protein
MTYLLDTDYIVDYLVGRRDAITFLSSLIPDGVGISLLTVGEIYEGIYYGRDPQKGEEGFRHFLRLVEVVPFDQPIMQQFARIRGELRRKGKIIGDCDILIAATAMQHNLTLVTRNVKDYQRIPELHLYQHS